MKKAKRYDEGGGVREGRNEGIDDDTRARAMKFVRDQQEAESTKSEAKSAPASKSMRKQLTSKTETSDNNASTPRRSSSPQSETTKKAGPEDIPTGGYAVPEGGVRGERVDSTELGRNFSGLMNATGPGRMATGLSLAAREAMAAKAAQKAYNARAATRRAEEGLNATEAAAAKQALREKKTLNPMAWMAGPKGMAENFKKGGMVKKMASGGMTSKASSASSRGDGIATKGKTRGRMC